MSGLRHYFVVRTQYATEELNELLTKAKEEVMTIKINTEARLRSMTSATDVITSIELHKDPIVSWSVYLNCYN